MGRKAIGTAGFLAASLAMLSTTACTRDYTLAYLYVTTTKSSPGVIDQYTVDYESGAIVEFGTPVAAGTNPVASVASPNATSIYVVEQGSNAVQQFSVGDGGALTAKTAYTTGNTPTALAIDTLGKFLYVIYNNGYSSSNTKQLGGITIFPINSDGSLGSPSNLSIGVNPVAVVIANFNATVYVVDQDPLGPQVLALAENTTTGALTPVSGTTATTGFAAGVQPSAIAEDPTGRFVYVTDQAANQLIGYVVQAGGGLLAMVNGPFATGQYPVALTIDPRGKYLYVTNYNANTLSQYALNVSTGAPSGVGASTATTDTGPVALAIDPALGVYLFTANKIESTVTGERLNANTGALTQLQNSPYPTGGAPTSVVLVANGSHPTELLYP